VKKNKKKTFKRLYHKKQDNTNESDDEVETRRARMPLPILRVGCSPTKLRVPTLYETVVSGTACLRHAVRHCHVLTATE
jgi:hypothetical protein